MYFETTVKKLAEKSGWIIESDGYGHFWLDDWGSVEMVSVCRKCNEAKDDCDCPRGFVEAERQMAVGNVVDGDDYICVHSDGSANGRDGGFSTDFSYAGSDDPYNGFFDDARKLNERIICAECGERIYIRGGKPTGHVECR